MDDLLNRLKAIAEHDWRVSFLAHTSDTAREAHDALAGLARLRAGADGWQAMDTAPKDGTQILLWSEMWEMSWGVQLGQFLDGKWVCGEGSVGEDETDEDMRDLIGGDDFEPTPIGPTRWHPIPLPPREDDDGPLAAAPPASPAAPQSEEPDWHKALNDAGHLSTARKPRP